MTGRHTALRRRLGVLGRADWARGARSAIALGFSFGVATAIAGLPYSVFAALGCYLDSYGRRDPFPRRGPLLLALAGGFVVAVLLGSLAAGNTWLTVVVLTLLAAAATLFVRTLHLSGPGSYFVVLVGALAAFLPPTHDDILLRLGYLAFGMACTWLMSMSEWLVRPYGPEERAVSTAFLRVADFAAVTRQDVGEDHPPIPVARQAAYSAVHTAWTAVDDSRWPGHRPPAQRRLLLYGLLHRLETVLDAVQDATEPHRPPVPAPWAPWLRTAAAEVSKGRTPDTWPGMPPLPSPEPPPASDDDRATDPALLGAAALLWPAPLPPRKRLRAELRQLLSRSSPTPAVAGRVALAVAVGTAVGAVLPLLHPSWVAAGAAAALQGGPGLQPVQRAGQRLAGTFIGVAVTALAFRSYQPGVWVIVIVATVLHSASRTVKPSHVAVIMLLNTPFVLLLADGPTPDTGVGELAAYRLLDFTLGLVVGVAASLLLRSVPPQRVHDAVARGVRAMGPLLRERVGTGTTGAGGGADSEAWRRMSDLWTMYASVPTEEVRSSGTADRLWPVVLATRRLLTWGVLAPPAEPARRDGKRVQRFTETLADAARTARTPTGSPVPTLRHHPELHDRLDTLRSALEGFSADTGTKRRS